MHDPWVVAFVIRRPWPRRSSIPVHRWWWPPMITVWHVEPHGRDSGEVCKHFRRSQDADGQWQITKLRAWRWHVHHWRIQVHPLQALRRWALTRCAWCGGRSTKRDAVNHSLSWNGRSGAWWRGEVGLYHSDCAGVYRAHGACLCDEPALGHQGYGTCSHCGKGRSYGVSPETLAIQRRLATLPVGGREVRP